MIFGRLCPLVALVAVGLLTWPQPVGAAAPAPSLKIAPAIEELAVAPGDTRKRGIRLTNLTGAPLPIKAYARAFVATDASGGSAYPDDTDPTAAQHWFTLDPPAFILPARATQIVGVTIRVPTLAEPGGHYATVFLESLVPQTTTNAASATLATRLGALYFLTVEGAITRRADITAVTTPPWRQTGPVVIGVTIANRGNVHVRPRVRAVIIGRYGQTLATITADTLTVLPQTTRQTILVWPRRWLLGRYTIRVAMEIDGLSPVETTSQFWAVPWGLFLTLLVGTLLAVRFGRRAKERFKRAWRVLIAPKKHVSLR